MDKSGSCWGGMYIFYQHYEGHIEVKKNIKTTTYDMIQESISEYAAEGKKLGCM